MFKNYNKIALIFLALTWISCYSRPYYDRNGKKFRNVNEAAEAWHIDSATVANYPFDLESYLAGTTNTQQQNQFVLPKDVQTVLSRTERLLVIIYNPE